MVARTSLCPFLGSALTGMVSTDIAPMHLYAKTKKHGMKRLQKGSVFWNWMEVAEADG